MEPRLLPMPSLSAAESERLLGLSKQLPGSPRLRQAAGSCRRQRLSRTPCIRQWHRDGSRQRLPRRSCLSQRHRDGSGQLLSEPRRSLPAGRLQL